MLTINIAAPDFREDPTDPPGFRSGRFRVGPLVGGSEIGASVYEILPGEALCPYHYEYGEEEWLLVLAGRPSVRHVDGTDTLRPWDMTCFPSGPAGAHQVRNDGDEPVRILMFSTVRHPAATVYPDSDKIAIWPGNPVDNLITLRSSAVDYFHGETVADERPPEG